MSSFDDQKPDKMKNKVNSNMPKDEEELDKKIEYWENIYLHTKSLKTRDEEDHEEVKSTRGHEEKHI